VKEGVVVGIHTPETPASRRGTDRGEGGQARAEVPIAVDNDGRTGRPWNNDTVATVYVVRPRGRCRYGWEGELSCSYTGQKGEETSAS